MKSRKGMELSVNFLVMTILSIAVFSMGVVFVNKIFRAADEKAVAFDAQTKAELARLLERGEKVALPFYRATARGGETHSFGVGILNVNLADEIFKVNVKFTKSFFPDNGPMCQVGGDMSKCPSDPQDWLVYDTEVHPLKPNDQGTYAIAVGIPKNDVNPGTYIYDVEVWYDSDCPGPTCQSGISTPPADPPDKLYESIQKIWVTVI